MELSEIVSGQRSIKQSHAHRAKSVARTHMGILLDPIPSRSVVQKREPSGPLQTLLDAMSQDLGGVSWPDDLEAVLEPLDPLLVHLGPDSRKFQIKKITSTKYQQNIKIQIRFDQAKISKIFASRRFSKNKSEIWFEGFRRFQRFCRMFCNFLR